MERILVFCARDWLHPKAGPVEHYVHEVFSRLVRCGHYVMLVSHTHSLVRFRKRHAPEMELVDGIQIARLGPRALFGVTSGMLLNRIHTNRSTITAFDAIIDCVTYRPMSLADHTSTPVIPLVFDLSPRVRAAKDLAGPVIATCERARRKLIQAGFPVGFIVRAPYGADCGSEPCPALRAPRPTLALLGEASRALKAALMILKKDGIPIEVEAVGCHGPRRARSNITYRGALTPVQREQVYQRSWIGMCGTGTEHEAIEMGAWGLPVICPNTDDAVEYVQDGRTGLLYEARDARKLADCLGRLVTDETLRKRLGTRGRELAEGQWWDRTAGLVLATIENLATASPPPPIRPDAILASK